MGKKTNLMRRNAHALLSNQFRRDINSVRLNTHNTLSHEMAKCKIAYELIKDGNQIFTEVVFKNGSRADILCLDTMGIYEILHSETKKEALTKTTKYPKSCHIIYLTSKEVLDEFFDEKIDTFK